MNKTIRSTGREIIYNVYRRCLAEQEAQTIFSDLDNIYQRTAVMAGKSVSTIRRVVLEEDRNKVYFLHPEKYTWHTVVRLPPYHCDLNPIELIWGIAKHKIAAQNVGSIDIKETAERAFQAITEEDWKNSCQHVIKIEKEYCEREQTLYEEIERLVINIEDDSSSTSKSKYDSDEFAASSSQ